MEKPATFVRQCATCIQARGSSQHAIVHVVKTSARAFKVALKEAREARVGPVLVTGPELAPGPGIFTGMPIRGHRGGQNGIVNNGLHECVPSEDTKGGQNGMAFEVL